MGSVVIFALRILLLVLIDITVSSLIPKLLFGTKDLDIIPDIVIKKAGIVFAVSWFTSGPLEMIIR